MILDFIEEPFADWWEFTENNSSHVYHLCSAKLVLLIFVIRKTQIYLV